ncbi:MAG: HAMP domain-containing sensor histidine kinase [Myxococcales bacterium]|nr:HAMP domain-containing sensor histidine kinase [Myxococcales bacterium]
MSPLLDVVPLVVALLVSFFGLLLAGHAFASRADPGMSTFAWAPLGVATMTVAALLHELGPIPRIITGGLAGVGATASFVGFALEAWRDPRHQARRRSLLIVAGALTAFVAIAVPILLSVSLPVWRVPLRALVFGPALFVVVSHASMRRLGSEQEQRFSSRMALAVSVAIAAAALASLPTLLISPAAASDSIGWLALAALAASWVQVFEGRVTVKLFATRALTWLVLFLGLVAVAAAAARQLDVAFDLPRVLTGVFATLLVGIAFVVVSEAASRRVDALFAPQRSALELELGRARETMRSMESKWSHLERLALAGELAAMVAHEIKNPLAAVRGWAETLGDLRGKLQAEDQARLDKALGIIRDESDRIDGRVQSLLQVARPPAPEPLPVVFHVNRVASEAVALVEGQSTHVSLTLLDADATVRGSPDGLRTALVNLLRNAIEANPSGQVDVRVARTAEGFELSVVDDGPGLAPEQLAQPVVAFRSTKPGGTGLGLVIAQAGVQACRGALSFSAATPRGTRARIVLPGDTLEQEA